ncbi:MAG: SAM-dependent methyltransferase [Pseudomonadales bacterium]
MYFEAAPFVPTPDDIVDEMLELARVGPDDYVIDLGSGDGRIVLTAAREHGARGFGVEMDEDLVALSSRSAQQQGVDDRVRFVQQDLFATDISEATVVTIYLLPETVNRLRGKLLEELEPGTRIVSHDYPIEGWASERVVRLEHEDKVAVTGLARTNLYLYRVPADVAGRWAVTALPPGLAEQSFEIEFIQSITVAQGRAHIDGELMPLDEASVNGRRLSFTLPERGARFTAWVVDGVMEGTVVSEDGRGRWRASRR